MKLELPEIPGHEWRECNDLDAFNGVSVEYKAALYVGIGSATYFIAKPIKRLYDWSKTGPDVLAYDADGDLGYLNESDPPYRLFEGWQVHHGGECSLHAEAVIVEVNYRDGSNDSSVAEKLDWVNGGRFSDIIAYRVMRLADGYSWS